MKTKTRSVINNYPSISIIIPTYNSTATIDKCLKSISIQDYPQGKIEILIADGGSTDRTLKIVLGYKTKLIKVDPEKQNVEFNKRMGILKARGEILFMLDHDNILPNKSIIKKMIKPFSENKKIVGVETQRYYYTKKATLLDRYIALFGVSDPLAWYFGKADRMSFMLDGYDKKYNPEDQGNYYLVRFKKNDIPTIGANGFMIKRKLLLNNADMRENRYFPTDVNVDLIKKGFDTYAFVKDAIYHMSGHGNVRDYLKRKMLFMKQYYLSDKNISLRKYRRYSLYEKKDFWKLVYFIIISLTFIVPMIDSLRGFLKIRDKAWFIHPVLCFGFVVIYGYTVLEHQIKIYKNKILN